MRVLAVCSIVALTGCSQVTQDISENISNVVYTVVEPSVPPLPRTTAPEVSLRPRARSEPVESISERVVNFFRRDPVAIDIAFEYVGYNERNDYAALKEFLGLDPRQTEWCAAFVNSSLHAVGAEGSESVSEYPLLARSFLEWGEPVPFKEDPESPKMGDIAIFPRGRNSWQGHVGFYIETVIVDGKHYWKILSGNQSNSVSINLYPANRALGLRRLAKFTTQPKTVFNLMNRRDAFATG